MNVVSEPFVYHRLSMSQIARGRLVPGSFLITPHFNLVHFHFSISVQALLQQSSSVECIQLPGMQLMESNKL
jgi:hypothetical protein